MAPIDDFGRFGKIHIPPGWQKPCGTSQWGEGGVLAVRSEAIDPPNPDSPKLNYDDYPIGIAPDGYGGAFVLAMANAYYPSSQGPPAMRPVSTSGKPGPLVRYGDPVWWIGLLGDWAEAAIVESGKGRCIVLWGKNQMEPGLRAQRYDQNARALWRSKKGSVQASGAFPTLSAGSRNNLVAEPDAEEGALACWIGQGNLPTAAAYIQRVNSNGKTLWGSDGISFGSAYNPYTLGNPPAGVWPQLVPDKKGGAIVLAPEPSGGAMNFVAYRISAAGALTGTPITLVTAPEQLVADRRLRRAVTDGAGGLYLGYTNAAGELRVLRYSPVNGVLWDNLIGNPVHPKAFQIREDGSGGLLIAWVSTGPFVRPELRRIDANGAATWDISASPHINQIQITPPPASAMFDEYWSMVAQPVPDGSGGAVLVFHNWILFKRLAIPKLFSICFDSTGTALASPQEITSRTTTQQFPVVVPGLGGALVAWADDGDYSVSGLDVWVQRAGCCVQTGLEFVPPFGCEILQVPGMGFGEMNFQLPCGNEDRQFGVIPLTRFFQYVRGLDFPPSILNRDATPPDWLRIRFSGLPEGTRVELFSMKGKKVVEAQANAAGVVLTFKPSKEDQLLIFSNTTRLDRGMIHRVPVQSAWGHGRPPAVRLGKTRPRAKTEAPRRPSKGSRKSKNTIRR